MKILILGATGGTGRNLLSQGLEQGHHITAFVRDPAKLHIKHKNLLTIKGDVLNQKEVENAVKGHDVVISVLGNKTSDAIWKSSTIISQGAKNIISGMQKHTVKRLLFVTSFGVNQNIFLPEKLFIKVFLRNIFADIPTQEKLIRESGLDWSIVHPARLVNTRKIGNYKMAVELPIGLFSQISRADVADFLLKNINSPTYIHKIVTISY